MSCDARQYGDEMKCGRCGLSWDVNDADRPDCSRAIDRRAIPDRRVTRTVAKMDEPTKPVVTYDEIPVRLPSGVKATIILPRPFTRADATHLVQFLAAYVEDRLL